MIVIYEDPPLRPGPTGKDIFEKLVYLSFFIIIGVPFIFKSGEDEDRTPGPDLRGNDRPSFFFLSARPAAPGGGRARGRAHKNHCYRRYSNSITVHLFRFYYDRIKLVA
jgi:hypothetical protein